MWRYASQPPPPPSPPQAFEYVDAETLVIVVTFVFILMLPVTGRTKRLHRAPGTRFQERAGNGSARVLHRDRIATDSAQSLHTEPNRTSKGTLTSSEAAQVAELRQHIEAVLPQWSERLTAAVMFDDIALLRIVQTGSAAS